MEIFSSQFCGYMWDIQIGCKFDMELSRIFLHPLTLLVLLVSMAIFSYQLQNFVPSVPTHLLLVSMVVFLGIDVFCQDFVQNVQFLYLHILMSRFCVECLILHYSFLWPSYIYIVMMICSLLFLVQDICVLYSLWCSWSIRSIVPFNN